MGGGKKTAAKVATAVAIGKVVYAKLAVEGKPVREPDKPAAVKLFGLTIFRRTESLEREWLGGLIKRGQSKRTKAALRERGEQ